MTRGNPRFRRNGLASSSPCSRSDPRDSAFSPRRARLTSMSANRFGNVIDKGGGGKGATGKQARYARNRGKHQVRRRHAREVEVRGSGRALAGTHTRPWLREQFRPRKMGRQPSLMSTQRVDLVGGSERAMNDGGEIAGDWIWYVYSTARAQATKGNLCPRDLSGQKATIDHSGPTSCRERWMQRARGPKMARIVFLLSCCPTKGRRATNLAAARNPRGRSSCRVYHQNLPSHPRPFPPLSPFPSAVCRGTNPRLHSPHPTPRR